MSSAASCLGMKCLHRSLLTDNKMPEAEKGGERGLYAGAGLVRLIPVCCTMTSALWAAFPDGKNLLSHSWCICLLFQETVQRNLNPQTGMKICRSPMAARNASRKQDKERYRMSCSLFSCPWKIMSAYQVLSCFGMTHLSADADFVQVGCRFHRVGRLSLWQVCYKRSAPRRNPITLGTARATSHFLLMRSYMAKGVQINPR